MHTHHHSPHTAPQGEIDPVCGMTVDPQHAAVTQVYAGQSYYFEEPGVEIPKETTGSSPRWRTSSVISLPTCVEVAVVR